MNAASTGMIDLVFDLKGERVPAAYPYALWDELVRRVPLLAEHDEIGVLPLRGSEHGQSILLARRTKLALRLPPSLVQAAMALEGARLELPEGGLALGKARTRELQYYPTLHAQLAAGADDETVFVEAVQAHFAALGIGANTICGKRRTLSDGRQSISGFSLVVHDLKPEASLLLQCVGMGEGRRFGCGIFMPYKVISDLE